MMLRKDNFGLNARPHPGPLPRGEGELLSVSRDVVSRRLPGALLETGEHSNAVPSPGGEGQGEGGRHTICFQNSIAQSAIPYGCEHEI